MYKKILFITTCLILGINSLFAVDLDKNPIYSQIIKNKPSINKIYAMKLSNVIYKMSNKYKIPSNIFTAILMQESTYSLKAKGKVCGVDKNHNRTCVFTDFGISQIHYKTIKLWNFDVDRLTNDLQYSVESGAKILHNIMVRFKKKDKNWYARYNCGFGGSTNRSTCQIYKQLVDRYM